MGVGTPRAGSKRKGLILYRDLYGSFEGALRELEGLDTWGLNDPNRVSGHVRKSTQTPTLQKRALQALGLRLWGFRVLGFGALGFGAQSGLWRSRFRV